MINAILKHQKGSSLSFLHKIKKKYFIHIHFFQLMNFRCCLFKCRNRKDRLYGEMCAHVFKSYRTLLIYRIGHDFGQVGFRIIWCIAWRMRTLFCLNAKRMNFCLNLKKKIWAFYVIFLNSITSFFLSLKMINFEWKISVYRNVVTNVNQRYMNDI